MKPAFFYAAGTAYFVHMMAPVLEGLSLLSLDLDQQLRIGGILVGDPLPAKTGTVLGVNGRNASWTLAPAGDPFPSMLDPELWDRREIIAYPASFLHIGASIDYGCARMIEKVQSLKPGQHWACGGYSQGAAVCSALWNNYGLKPGTSGPLAAYRDRWLGFVGFGNPARQIDHRGAAGEFGTWSGSWYDPDVHTGCGGAFPATGPHRRLTGCPDEWVDFAAPLDIFTAHGSSTVETNWTNGIDFALGSLDPGELINLIVTNSLGGVVETAMRLFGFNGGDGYGATGDNYFVDGAGMKFPFPGGGHTTYPMLPPPDTDGVIPTIPVLGDDGITTYHAPDGPTCYQLAIEFMDGLAKPFQVAPIVLPPSAAGGWSTTLVPPAA